MLNIQNSTVESICDLLKNHTEVIFSISKKGIFLYCLTENGEHKVTTKECRENYGMFGEKKFIIPNIMRSAILELLNLVKRENSKIDINQIYKKTGNELHFSHESGIAMRFEQIKNLNFSI